MIIPSKNKLSTQSGVLFFLILFLLKSNPINAAIVYWVGDGSNNNWHSNINWYRASIPSGVDTVQFKSDTEGEIYISQGNVNIGSLMITQVDKLSMSNGISFAAGAVTLGASNWGNTSKHSVIEITDGALFSMKNFTAGAGENSGSIYVNKGGRAITSGVFLLGNKEGSDWRIYINGSDSSWEVNNNLAVIANEGYGELHITNGATFSQTGNNAVMSISDGKTSEARVYIDGDGSKLVTDGVIVVGGDGYGEMRITNGAKVQSGHSNIAQSRIGGFGPSGIGTEGRGNGLVEVSGAGSAWVVDDSLYVSGQPELTSGMLNLTEGGLLSLTGSSARLYIGAEEGTGTVNIGGEQAGVIKTINGVFIGDNGDLNLKHGDYSQNYVFENELLGTGLFNVQSGWTNFEIDSSEFDGITTVSGAILSLNGSLGSRLSHMYIENTGVLAAGAATGASPIRIGGDVTNSGKIILDVHERGTYNTLTIGGNYISVGGSLHMNTSLGDDTSPTDLLIIEGDTLIESDPTAVYVQNLASSQAGAETKDNGIMLIEVLGHSQKEAFQLGSKVKAGAYEYELFQGGVSTPEDGNWYLRSTSHYTPESKVYVSTPGLAYHIGLAMLGTYHDRRGDSAQHYPGWQDDAAWGRIFGTTGRHKGKNSARSDYDYNIGGFQTGVDIYRTEKIQSGAYFGLAYGSGDVDKFEGGYAGKNSMNAVSFGVYWTKHNEELAYFDAIAQATRLHRIKSKSSDDETMKTKGWLWAVSFEGGKPYKLDESWTFEPQGQVIWEHLKIDSANDRFAQVDYEAADIFFARLGVRFKKEMENGKQFFVRANLWHEFGDDPAVKISNLEGLNTQRFESNLGGTYGQFGTGMSFETSKDSSLFISADYAYGNKVRALSGQIGFEYRF